LTRLRLNNPYQFPTHVRILEEYGSVAFFSHGIGENSLHRSVVSLLGSDHWRSAMAATRVFFGAERLQMRPRNQRAIRRLFSSVSSLLPSVLFFFFSVLSGILDVQGLLSGQRCLFQSSFRLASSRQPFCIIRRLSGRRLSLRAIFNVLGYYSSGRLSMTGRCCILRRRPRVDRYCHHRWKR